MSKIKLIQTVEITGETNFKSVKKLVKKTKQRVQKQLKKESLQNEFKVVVEVINKFNSPLIGD